MRVMYIMRVIIVVIVIKVMCSNDKSNDRRNSSSNHGAMEMCLDCHKKAQLME